VTEQDRLIAQRYRLDERVGAGAMGVVWRARDERLRRTVAVKQLLAGPGLDAEQIDQARARALREARITARLQHVNVVIVYDIAEVDGQPWLVMEYVPSLSLATALRDGPLPPYRVANIGAQAAAGLAAAHDVGVVHRDVKPGNVLLGEDGIVKIADFGMARATDDVLRTATGVHTGTPAYLAPEQAKGEQPVAASDVFALGATLYAAVEGGPPFGLHDNPLALLHLVAGGQVRPPVQAGPLAGLLTELLRADPADRPTMHEAQAELAAVAAEPTQPGGVPVPDAARAWTALSVAPTPVVPAAVPARPRRHSIRWSLGAMVLVLVVGVALVMLNRTPQQATSHAAALPPPRPPSAPATTTSAAPTFTAMSDLVRHYYDLLPTQVGRAYGLLAPAYQLAHPLPAAKTFYGGIQQVSAADFTARGPDMVSAVITFVTKAGATSHEPYRFTVQPDGSTLIIADAVRLA
jgi:serine/threonine protein kinase